MQPIINSDKVVHPIADAEKRAEALENAKHEMDILYEASNKLVRATTPAELLDAVSDYPREIGAVNATMGYFDNWHPQWLEIVAVWATAPIHSAKVGSRADVSERSLPMKSISNPEHPLLVGDLFGADFVGEISLELARSRKLRAMALLPLHFNGRWIGTLTFGFAETRTFTDRDERIFTALHQQLSSFAAFKRLLQETQTRASELEIARHEMNFLYEASHKLVKAGSPLEQLDAISEYARSNGANRGALVYCEFEDGIRIEEIVAEWTINPCKPLGVGTQLRYPLGVEHPTEFVNPHKAVFFKNAPDDERLTPQAREIDLHFSIIGCVVLPIFIKDRRIATIMFGWDHPYDFDDRDARIYTVLQQQVTAVLDSVRLFERLQKRASELELANYELGMLYKTSELINSANTYQEVVEAVAQFDLDADVVTLMLWDTWDWETANYLDVPVVIDRHNTGGLKSGSRLPKDAFPIAKVMMGQRVWLFEDAETDPRIDPITAVSWAALGIRSFMGPALYNRKAWLGGITFHSSKPRTYSHREERLLAGVGDLVLAAIMRIRLQNETEASRKHAETLAQTNAELLQQAQQRATELEVANAEIDLMYRIGEGINAANTYTELVTAVSGIIYGATAVALFFWEGRDYETATYVEQVAATGYLLPFVGRRIEKHILAYTADNQSERLMVFEDVTTDSRFDDETIAHYIARELKAAISIRLYVKNRWIGALVFNSNTPHNFSEKDKRLASGVGDYVVGAVERIRLHDESETARHEAERHARQAQKLASLEERTRLARELHDSVSQVLYGIGLGARTARTIAKQDPSKLQEPLDYILSLAEAGLTEMRALIFELRPESLEHEGLITTLNKQALSLSARYDIHVDTQFCDEPELPLEEKESLYRIAREALHNTVKHAQASSVRLAVLDLVDGYRLEIEDNGIGFDTNQTFTGHLGLKSMRERTIALGGVLDLTSSVGTGTKISISLSTKSL